MKVQPCPHCGRKNEVHSDAEGKDILPSAGDLSICWRCEGFAVFDDDEGTLRKATDREYAKFMADPKVTAMLYAMKVTPRPTEAVKMYGGIYGRRP